MKQSVWSIAVILLVPALTWAQANLENPLPDSSQSGIGIISGWKCQAGAITVVFDNHAPLQASYGTGREDTRVVCDDANNGFGLLWNFNLLGPGVHTVRVFDDGVQFASAIFTVTTLGQEFLRGAQGRYILEDFPEIGTEVTVQWQESTQNFVIIGLTPESSATPFVDGRWRLDLSFFSEDCTFLDTPPFPETRVMVTLEVEQVSSTALIARWEDPSVSLQLSGTLDAAWNFVFTLPPIIVSSIIGSCALDVVSVYRGNFLSGVAVWDYRYDKIHSGTCPDVIVPCTVSYVGPITRVLSPQ